VAVLKGFGCSGANLPPQLKWTNVPASTKSFALTRCTDRPRLLAWVVVDIPPTVSELPKGWGKSGTVSPEGGSPPNEDRFRSSRLWGPGPCPPYGRGHARRAVRLLNIADFSPTNFGIIA
jgi:phosphatidylethanolamine-binding protein (PEBP) family uncharacterized protein